MNTEPFTMRNQRSGPLPVTVLCGFLGSGKTTLLQRLLRADESKRFAVIVNDLSELAVDAELIGLYREGREDKLVSLNRGSLGGVLRNKFRDALDRFASDEEIDYLLIETSGGTQPAAMVEDITHHPGLRLDTFATVVDGLNLLRDYDCGRALLDPELVGVQSPASLLLSQIAPASLLLVSKADLLTRNQAESIVTVLQQVNPGATLVTMAYGSVEPAFLLNARTFRRRKSQPVANVDDPAEFDIGSDVLADPRPFHPVRLHTLFTHRLPFGLHRSKGWLWLASRPMDVFIWNQSGSHFGLEWSGTWRVAMLSDPAMNLQPDERDALLCRLPAGHPIFGDRACELTIIGPRSLRTVFLESLRSCFCTEDEILAWRRGEGFEDPWPESHRKV